MKTVTLKVLECLLRLRVLLIDTPKKEALVELHFQGGDGWLMAQAEKVKANGS